jgi:hypothetical protein
LALALVELCSLACRVLVTHHYQPARQYWEVDMGIEVGTAMLISSAIGAATAFGSAAMAPKPPKMAALPPSKVPQVSKQADKETANMIKSAKLRSGPATPNTLLTGSQGVADEELNLGGTRLI